MMESVSRHHRHHRHHPNRHRHDHAIWGVYGVYAFYSVCDDVYCDDRNTMLKNLAQLKYLSVKQLLLNLMELKHTMLI